MTPKEENFRKIAGEHQGRIRNICRHYARTEDDIQDLVQEVMINVWRNLDSFRGDAALSTWIYRIAVNTSLSYIMKENRRSGFSLSLENVNAAALLDEDSSENSRELELRENALQDAINRLSVIDKLLISLSVEKVSTREMADIIGITEPNVRTKLHRIREELKNMLKGGNYEL